MVRTIDSHVHVYPPEINRDPAGWAAANGEAHWSKLCTRRRRDGSAVQAFPALDEVLRAMDGAGVERAILLGWYWENPASCLRHNRFCADCVRAHPDRLAAFAALHPAAGAAAVRAEIQRLADEGFAGLGELSPHSQGKGIGDPAWPEAFAVAGELRLPVTLHATDPHGRSYPGRVPAPAEDFVRWAREFPRTKFVLAHWGGLLPLRKGEVAGMRNVFYDTAASPLLYDEGIWLRFISAVGPDRVLFGSDYPLNLYPKVDGGPDMGRLVAEALAAGLAPAARAALMGENALRLLAR